MERKQEAEPEDLDLSNIDGPHVETHGIEARGQTFQFRAGVKLAKKIEEAMEESGEENFSKFFRGVLEKHFDANEVSASVSQSAIPSNAEVEVARLRRDFAQLVEDLAKVAANQQKPS